MLALTSGIRQAFSKIFDPTEAPLEACTAVRLTHSGVSRDPRTHGWSRPRHGRQGTATWLIPCRHRTRRRESMPDSAARTPSAAS